MTLAPEALLVLLLEPLEPPIDLVEVPEHLVLQRGDHLGEPTIHLVDRRSPTANWRPRNSSPEWAVWLCNPTTL